jgi:hypothetical protein
MRSASSPFIAISVLLLGAAPAVSAADDTPSVESRVSRRPDDRLTPYGAYFLLGGGVSNFIDGTVRDRVDLGGAWDLRLGLGSRFFLGAEAAYVGSARTVEGFGTNLLTNGAEGVVRLQYPYEAGRWLVEPFAFGGAGWTHFNLNSAPAGQPDTDDVFEVPFGGGVTLSHDRLLLDARFTYRQTFNESLIRAADGNAASLKSWGVVASLGYEF